MATASLPLFPAGMAERDAGILKAVEGRNELVNRVRLHLANVAKARGNRCVTADDAEPYLTRIGKTTADLGNAAGGIFRSSDWEYTGVTTPSTRRSSHYRHVRVWRLK